MKKLEYEIIEAGPEWADKYRAFCRLAYMDAYTRPELGITREQFSEEVFSSPRVARYYQEIFAAEKGRQAWLAVSGREIFGGVAAQREPDYCEMQSFYVRSDLKGRGIGHALYQKVLEFADGMPIQVDVVRYMQSSIDMYKHWGFEIDESKGEAVYEWVEWPEKARQAYRGIYMVRPGRANVI